MRNKHFFNVFFALFLAVSFLQSQVTYASVFGDFGRATPKESIGSLELSHLLLEPQAYVSENRSGGFQAGYSHLGVVWQQDRKFWANLVVGSKEMLGVPRWVSTTTSKELVMVEGFAQIKTDLGSARLGLLPIYFGWEGTLSEEELWLPRSMFYQWRYVPLRDLGASYMISNDQFATHFAIHNGEAGEQQDTQSFYTGQFRYLGKAGFTAGLSGHVGGYTNTVKTVPRYRVGNVFASLDLYGIGFALEGNVGEERESDTSSTMFWAAHADLQHNIGNSGRILFRYDQLNPQRGGIDYKETSVGFKWFNHYETSSVLLLYTRHWELPSNATNNSYKLIWRITSLSR